MTEQKPSIEQAVKTVISFASKEITAPQCISYMLYLQRRGVTQKPAITELIQVLGKTQTIREALIGQIESSVAYFDRTNAEAEAHIRYLEGNFALSEFMNIGQDEKYGERLQKSLTTFQTKSTIPTPNAPTGSPDSNRPLDSEIIKPEDEAARLLRRANEAFPKETAVFQPFSKEEIMSHFTLLPQSLSVTEALAVFEKDLPLEIDPGIAKIFREHPLATYQEKLKDDIQHLKVVAFISAGKNEVALLLDDGNVLKIAKPINEQDSWDPAYEDRPKFGTRSFDLPILQQGRIGVEGNKTLHWYIQPYLHILDYSETETAQRFAEKLFDLGYDLHDRRAYQLGRDSAGNIWVVDYEAVHRIKNIDQVRQAQLSLEEYDFIKDKHPNWIIHAHGEKEKRDAIAIYQKIGEEKFRAYYGDKVLEATKKLIEPVQETDKTAIELAERKQTLITKAVALFDEVIEGIKHLQSADKDFVNIVTQAKTQLTKDLDYANPRDLDFKKTEEAIQYVTHALRPQLQRIYDEADKLGVEEEAHRNDIDWLLRQVANETDPQKASTLAERAKRIFRSDVDLLIQKREENGQNRQKIYRITGDNLGQANDSYSKARSFGENLTNSIIEHFRNSSVRLNEATQEAGLKLFNEDRQILMKAAKNSTDFFLLVQQLLALQATPAETSPTASQKPDTETVKPPPTTEEIKEGARIVSTTLQQLAEKLTQERHISPEEAYQQALAILQNEKLT